MLRFLLKDVPVEESDEVADGLILDYDAAGNTVGMELLDAFKHLANPRAATSRVPGLNRVQIDLNRGQIEMADDFDAPRPDEFWRGIA